MANVAAVVVTHDAEREILPCLDALGFLKLGRIAIVDNASRDATVPIVEAVARDLRRHGQTMTCLRSSTNLGFGAGVNAVASGLDCDALLLVNPDCILPAETFQRMVRYLETHPGVGAVGPGMVDGQGVRRISGGAWPSLTKEVVALLGLDALVPVRARPALGLWMRRHRLLHRLSPYLETMADVGPVAMDWLSGFCLLVRMSAWQQAGGFDPSFFLYYEDVDLCRRVHEHGSDVVCLTDVAATHLGSVSSKRVGKRRLLLGGMCTYFSKHGSAGQRLPARVLGAAL